MANLRVDKITSTETFETTGSVQFDGTGDYLDVTESNNDFDFDGDFTIEFWVYFNTVNARNDTVGSANNSVYLGASKSGWIASYYTLAGNKWHFSYQSNQAWIFEHTFSFTSEASRWYHVAFTREDSSIKCFVDGVQQGETKISSTTLTSTENSVRVGGGEGSTSLLLNGYVSNLRVIKGKALYTSNFKTPMRELEITPETTLLCCQSKTDATLEKTGKTITVNGTAVASELTPGILTPIVKSGGGSAITGSVEFTGSPSKLTADSVDFAMGSNDLTMECWFYNGVDTSAHLVQIDTSPTQSPSDITNFTIATRDLGSGDVRFLVRNDSNSNLIDLVSSTGLANINAWHHLAGTIEGTTARLFLNGVLIKSGTLSGTRTHTGQRLNIGANQTSRYLKGYLSNVRIVKGTALYTDSFIPPTRELKRVPGTVLLACQDPDNPLTEATGKTITGYGSLQRTDGPELVTNGYFNNGTTGWSVTGGAIAVTSGQLQLTNSNTTLGKVDQTITTVVGQTYQVSALVTPDGGGHFPRLYVGADNDYTPVVSSANIQQLVTVIYTAVSTSTVISLNSNTNNANAVTLLDDVSAYDISYDADAPASNFTPQVGDDRQVTFEGVTKINSDAYFYLPTGNTESREATGTYNAGTRGVALGGDAASPNPDTIIDYITIASTGDAIDFGDLAISDSLNGDAVADHTRGVCLGGRSNSPTPNSRTNAIQFVTISSTGNSQDFGDLVGMKYGMAGFSDSTRGISAGGGVDPNSTANIDYITISSKGDGQDFGDCINTITYSAGFSSPTRGIKAGGAATPGAGAELNHIEYMTIQTTGNGQDFGDLIRPAWRLGGCSNAVRGVILEGETPAGDGLKAMSFVTIASMGNAQEFGDSTTAGQHSNGTSSSTRGVFMGRQGASPYANLTFIDFVHIMTTANAQDFGDLTIGRQGVNACSNGHGGLG